LSLEEFVRSAVADASEAAQEIRELQQLLENIADYRQSPRVYLISVTSNT
jgi:hypothetical protein